MQYRSIVVIILILLFPFSVAAFDLLQEKSQVVYSPADFFNAGQQAFGRGEYQEALNNYNKAEELIASENQLPGSKYDQLMKMADCEVGKSAAYSKMGMTAEAQAASDQALKYDEQARQVSKSEGWCIIATSTFGSPLAPQVQQLREFRQDTIYATESGAQFMTAFNAWYYSFSPSVAIFIDNHPAIKPAMQAILTPLLWILTLAKWSYASASVMPGLAVIVSGLVASTLIGVVYAFPVMLALLLVVRRFHPFTVTSRFITILCGCAVVGFALLGYGGLLSLRPALMAGSVLFVVSLVFLSALALSRLCIRRLDLRPADVPAE